MNPSQLGESNSTGKVESPELGSKRTLSWALATHRAPGLRSELVRNTPMFHPPRNATLLQAMNSKNSRTRSVCLLELSRCIEEDGTVNVLGRKGLRELVR